MVFCHPVFSQNISNIRAVQSGDDILIYYNLNGGHSNSQFEVRVYCSTDGGITWGKPLTQIEGDANKIVFSGIGKTVTWHVLQERNELTGSNIQFEIRAKPISAPAAEFTGTVLIDQRDQKSYAIIKIKDTYWMAENLNYSGAGSYCYNNDNRKCEKYGRLYTWDEAKKSCPSGWKLPEEKDWNEMEIYLGLPVSQTSTTRWRGTDQGKKLKKGESSGFDALYGGYRTENGTFDRIGTYSYFWSGTQYDVLVAYCRLLLYTHPGIYFNKYNKYQAMSVRCIKDSAPMNINPSREPSNIRTR